MARTKRSPQRGIQIVITRSSTPKRRQRRRQFIINFNRRSLVIAREPITPKRRRRQWSWPFTQRIDLVITRQASLRSKPTAPIKLFLAYRNLLTITLVVAGLSGLAFFGWQLNSSPRQAPVRAFSLPTPVTAQAPAGLDRSEPKTLEIPAIGVKTRFIELGKKSDGTMETPKGYEVAGWYKYGPTPGEIGPAVVVGHVDNYQGPAVFWRLGQLKSGDMVIIKRADGSKVKFKVHAVKQYPQNNFPTAKVYGNLDYAGLRLITCGGQFNSTTLEYDRNTVVYASIVN